MKFSHLNFAHSAWDPLLKKGAIAIDATCGNGHDSLYIAEQILEKDMGSLYICDIQQAAIELTKSLLTLNLTQEAFDRIYFYTGCHSSFPKEIMEGSADLIVYNLGYLPKGNKSLTTCVSTTLQSVEQALKLIKKNGLISITCYPGHEEGAKEEKALLAWAEELSPLLWSVSFHKRINYSKAPSVLFISLLD